MRNIRKKWKQFKTTHLYRSIKYGTAEGLQIGTVGLIAFLIIAASCSVIGLLMWLFTVNWYCGLLLTVLLLYVGSIAVSIIKRYTDGY